MNDANDLDAAQADYAARILSTLDVQPAPVPSPEVAAPHDYQPSLNPMDQGDCAICGNGPHTRVMPAMDVAALVEAAYVQGATDVHNNWQADKAPDFSEAATDYRVAALARKGGA